MWSAPRSANRRRGTLPRRLGPVDTYPLSYVLEDAGVANHRRTTSISDSLRVHDVRCSTHFVACFSVLGSLGMPSRSLFRRFCLAALMVENGTACEHRIAAMRGWRREGEGSSIKKAWRTFVVVDNIRARNLQCYQRISIRTIKLLSPITTKPLSTWLQPT